MIAWTDLKREEDFLTKHLGILSNVLKMFKILFTSGAFCIFGKRKAINVLVSF